MDLKNGYFAYDDDDDDEEEEEEEEEKYYIPNPYN
jgi:hypothetical protein